MNITRISTGVLALALLAPAARAQWTGGIKAGSGQGAFTGTSEFTWKPGVLTASAFASRPVVGPLSLQPEILLTQKLGESVVGSTSLTFEATYLAVPVLLRYDVTRAAVRPYFLFGPSLVVQSQCNVQFVASGLLSEASCEDNAGSFNKIDLGAEAGVGLRVPFGRVALLLEGRGSTSLRTELVPLATSRSRSFGWSVLAGFSSSLTRARRPSGAAPLPGTPVRVPEAPQSTTTSSIPPRLPALPAESIVEERSPMNDSARVAAPPSSRPISISAVNADVRPLIIGIAREAGIDLIVTSDVNRRVSLNLKDVTAMEAIAAIAAAANLTVAVPRQRELPAVVFYQLAVDVNKEGAETIAARFGVSTELARFIVASRPKN